MARSETLAGQMAVIGGSLGYLLCDFGVWPKLMYEPYRHEWLVATEPVSSAAMVYPGMLLWGATGALGCAAVTLVLTTKFSWTPSPATSQLLGAWAITAPVFACFYYLWGLWPF